MLTHLESLNSPALKQQRAYYGKLIPLAYGFAWFFPLKFLISWALFFRPFPRRPITMRDVDEVSIKSAALAAENFMLAIAAQNFDTCPMEGFDEWRVRKLLGLGFFSARVVMVISVGERDPQKGIWGTQYRFPKDWFVKEV